MTEDQMIQFIDQRIDLISSGKIHEKIPQTNGVLVHIIPEDQKGCSPIDWNNAQSKHQQTIKHAFRRFSDLKSKYIELPDGILSVNPDREYYFCSHIGIVETYISPISIDNLRLKNLTQLKIDNIFYQIRNTLDAAKIIHNRIYNSNSSYKIYVTLLGIGGTIVYSIDKGYTLTEGFPAINGRFAPFTWYDMEMNIMPEIIEGIHNAIKSMANSKNI